MVYLILFVRGFFKTAYKFGKPFVSFTVVGFLVISLAESLRYIPGLEALNSLGFNNISIQLTGLMVGFIINVLLNYISYKYSVKSFERIDL